MHQILSLTKYARMNGPNATPVDFAETPSMLMEQYAFLPSVLKRIGRHYSYISEEYNAAWKEGKDETVKQPSEILSDNVIEQLRVNKNAYSAWDAINQVFLGKYDMRINALPPSELDSTTLFNQMRKQIEAWKGIESSVLKSFHEISTWSKTSAYLPYSGTNMTLLEGPEALDKGWKAVHRQSQFGWCK